MCLCFEHTQKLGFYLCHANQCTISGLVNLTYECFGGNILEKRIFDLNCLSQIQTLMGFEAVFDDLLSQDFCYFCGLPFIMWVNLAKKKKGYYKH